MFSNTHDFSADPDYREAVSAFEAEDYPAAYRLFIPFAKQEDAHALFAIGLMHQEGLGTEKSPLEAIPFYKLASRQGDYRAMYNLALLYFNGDCGKPDYPAAAKYFKRAADQGDPFAQFQLGVMYYSGKGIEQSPQKALAYLAAAVESSDPTRQGTTHPANDKKIAQRSPADCDAIRPKAQYMLGILCANGIGMAPDYVTAKYLFEEAAAQGLQEAIDLLGIMKPSLPEEPSKEKEEKA